MSNDDAMAAGLPMPESETLAEQHMSEPSEHRDLFEMGYRQGWRDRDLDSDPRYRDLPTTSEQFDKGYDAGRSAAREKDAALRAEAEPVGPYAPTRDSAPKPKGSMVLGDIEWLTARFNSIESRLDGLVDVYLKADERALTRHQELRKDAECTIDHEATSEHAFRSGKTIGQAEREAELLEAGWTPPGAVVENVIAVSTGPTDYEVWRDALTLSVSNVFPVSEPDDAIVPDVNRRWSQIAGDAREFRELLQDVLKNDDCTDTTPVEPCPECRAGKHGNCPESVLDAADEMVPCPCTDTSHLF